MKDDRSAKAFEAAITFGEGKLTKEELEALDEDVDWKHAKQQWKVDNPDDSIKSYKDWYLSGKINSLPWEEYLPKKKRPYLMKENGQQKKGTAVE